MQPDRSPEGAGVSTDVGKGQGDSEHDQRPPSWPMAQAPPCGTGVDQGEDSPPEAAGPCGALSWSSSSPQSQPRTAKFLPAKPTPASSASPIEGDCPPSRRQDPPRRPQWRSEPWPGIPSSQRLEQPAAAGPSGLAQRHDQAQGACQGLELSPGLLQAPWQGQQAATPRAKNPSPPS